jgi:hypothetical protein
MIQWSGNRDMQDQGGYSCLVTEICRTRDDTVWSGNRDMQDQGW